MTTENIDDRLKKLEVHLKKENEILVDVIRSFRTLDRVAYQLGILNEEQSYATRVPWWPMISILGTFSSGKSTFINHYLNHELQRSGNQAVDDKFTVVSYSDEAETATLPGSALDSDSRFPFYQIGRDISNLTKEERPHSVDSYLQLKTCSSENLRGKILIDSPGFDADSQRDATLKLTQHIIDLSDLVLIFFDARHPEPGSMRDTLEHLVTTTIHHTDTTKFVYVLNQMDTTVRGDNSEEVVAAWRRALAQVGLTAGRFYCIYNEKVAVPIDDHKMKAKYESDLKEIHDRMNQMSGKRAYRLVEMLKHTAKDIEDRITPKLQTLIQQWKTSVYIWDSVLLILLLIALVGWYATTGSLPNLPQTPEMLGVFGSVLLFIGGFVHTKTSRMVANRLAKKLNKEMQHDYMREGLIQALGKNTTGLRALFMPFVNRPAGWNVYTQRRIHQLLEECNSYVVRLNNQFTNPSGREEDEGEIVIEETVPVNKGSEA